MYLYHATTVWEVRGPWPVKKTPVLQVLQHLVSIYIFWLHPFNNYSFLLSYALVVFCLVLGLNKMQDVFDESERWARET